ncbi:hypothetical protein SCLCIDRAFT_1213202 [Scleroderma citrinum Foug A]|uniref:Uncharacterized protein n=1 Tax=Scleroderma citrinum Foug A TaxID=1036808 RepID=A0A0C3E9P1_9AGAM|nr:hypothetical protein SCLCIDRAFT_1213202 [Scleroderma citrinum Foug A]
MTLQPDSSPMPCIRFHTSWVAQGVTGLSEKESSRFTMGRNKFDCATQQTKGEIWDRRQFSWLSSSGQVREPQHQGRLREMFIRVDNLAQLCMKYLRL